MPNKLAKRRAYRQNPNSLDGAVLPDIVRAEAVIVNVEPDTGCEDGCWWDRCRVLNIRVWR